jgi:hypothetical protein
LEGLLATRRVAARPPSRRIRRSLAAVATVASTLVMAGSATAATAPHGWTRVGDASGAVSLAVPDGWAGQLRDRGWDPAVIGLAEERGPGLLIGRDLGEWSDVESPTPGVFVGVSRTLRAAEPTLPDHSGCTDAADRTVTVGTLGGIVAHWTRCGGTETSFSEVTLVAADGSFGVYVQVKQTDGVDRTDEVLGTLRVDTSMVAQR